MELELSERLQAEESEERLLDSVCAGPVSLEPTATVRVATQRIAGRLRACAAAWREMGADAEVMGWVEHGYRIPFAIDRDSVPPYSSSGNGSGCSLYKHWLHPAVAEMVAVGAVSLLAEGSTPPRVVSRIDVVPKATPGKFRLILDLRIGVNQYVQRRPFKYETLGGFRSLINEGDFFFSFDLESGYFHVDVAPEDRKFFGFSLEGRYYVFNVLPFGLRDACFAFTKLCLVPVQHLRRLGFRVLAYIDDFLFAILRRDFAAVAAARAVLERLGFLISMSKSVFDPTQRIESLGFVVDSVRMVFELKPARAAKFLAAANAVLDSLASDDFAAARDVARVVGLVASASLVFGRTGTLYSRYLVDSIVDVARSRAWSHWVSLGPKALAELRSWIVRVESGFAASIIPERRPPALVFLASDAGDVGWGGHVVQPLGSVAVSPLPPAHDVFSPADRARSSTWRELRGVCCVLSAYGREIEGQSVDFQVDSLTSALIHVKGGSLRRDAALGRLLLQEELLAIEDICLARRVWLRLVWVPRELNQLADDESKIVDVHNYSLCHDQFLFLSERWGPYDVDRFAAASNTQLPCFNSRWACPGSSAVDAFRADWRGFNNWLHPPTPLIAAVLQKMRADGASGTLLAPYLPSATWWPLLYPRDRYFSPVRDWWVFDPWRFESHEPLTVIEHGSAPWPMRAFRLVF